MKPSHIIPFLLLAALLAACGQAAETLPAATSAPELPFNAGVVTASAEVVPAQVSELSFPVSGPVREIMVKSGEHVQAGQALAALDMPGLSGAVLQAEAALLAASKDREYYLVPRRQGLIPAKRPWKDPIAGPLEPPERLWLAEAQLAVAQAALDSAKADLAQTVLSAPFAGTVTDVKVVPGEVVGAGEVVVVLAGLDQLQIETTDLGEQRIASVQPGQPASVYIEALDQDFSGKVVRIAPMANKEGGDVYYQVTIALDEQPPGMLWGMSAEVKIETE